MWSFVIIKSHILDFTKKIRYYYRMKYWTKIQFPGNTFDETVCAIKWCKKNIKNNNWEYLPGMSIFMFKYKKDAYKFRMVN